MITHDENGNWTASKKDGGKHMKIPILGYFILVIYYW